MHREVQAGFDEEFLQLLVVDKAVLLTVDQVEQIFRLMLSELSADL